MALTKLYQIVQINGESLDVWKTYRTEEECEAYMNSDDLSDYMGTITLTILPIWTNLSKADIKDLLDDY